MPSVHPDPARRAEARDRGLRRVRTTTGFAAVAAAVGSVVLAGGYAAALPGSSAPSDSSAHAGATQTDTRQPNTARTQTPPSAGSTATPGPAAGLQPPAQPPQPAPVTTAPTHHVVSGAS